MNIYDEKNKGKGPVLLELLPFVILDPQRFGFSCNLNRQLWNFIKFCEHIDIHKINIYNRKIWSRGPFLLELLLFVILCPRRFGFSLIS